MWKLLLVAFGAGILLDVATGSIIVPCGNDVQKPSVTGDTGPTSPSANTEETSPTGNTDIVEASCLENQIYSNCSNAICRHQDCSQRGQPIACPAVSSCDKGCVCAEGYLKNSNGNCVKEEQCDVEPLCLENQVYSNCSNALCRAEKCEQKGIPVACPGVSSCDKACVCAVGFLKNSKGICVKEDECDVGPNCPENQVFSNCTNGLCRHQECYERGQPLGCPGLVEGSCLTGCVCDVGYLKNTNGNCVKEEECDAGFCPKNEVFSNCSNGLCRALRCTQRGKPVPCPLMPPGSCVKGCVCTVGYLRNKANVCVKEAQCDYVPACPQNEIFSTCANGLCRAQKCSQKDQPIACPAMAEGSCKSACVCVQGYLRNKTNKCVKKEKCN